MFSGVISFLVGVVAANYIAGNFGDIYHWGFTSQPIALPYADADGGIIWTQYIWSFLSFTLVGLAATLMGGCPLRNTILAGEGDTDAGISVLGYIAGGAIAMNFMVASSVAGMGKYGAWGVVACLAFCLTIGFIMREKDAA